VITAPLFLRDCAAAGQKSGTGTRFSLVSKSKPATYTHPYKWWNWHDDYNAESKPDPQQVKISDPGEAAFRKHDARSESIIGERTRKTS
jgi:hypothetical protein